MDDTGQRSGVFKIEKNEAKGYNDKNYGIFWTFNSFKDGVRRKENLDRVNAWAIDIDDGTKEDQLKAIEKSPLAPSMLVETKRGYQVYWFAKDGTMENYEAIVLSRLVPHFNADKKARDVCRILRFPNYYHCKDPNDKFLVKGHYAKFWLQYSEKEMLSFFKPKIEKRKEVTFQQQKVEGDSFWHKVGSIQAEYGLSKLSGSSNVSFENFDFRSHSNGVKQICVNEKPTSNWIDKDGMIGSYERGGPTIANWLNWYHNDWRKVAEICKETFKQELGA